MDFLISLSMDLGQTTIEKTNLNLDILLNEVMVKLILERISWDLNRLSESEQSLS